MKAYDFQKKTGTGRGSVSVFNRIYSIEDFLIPCILHRTGARLSLEQTQSESGCPNDLTAMDAGGEDKIKLSLERELRPDSVWWRAGRDSNPRPFDS